MKEKENKIWASPVRAEAHILSGKKGAPGKIPAEMGESMGIHLGRYLPVTVVKEVRDAGGMAAKTRGLDNVLLQPDQSRKAAQAAAATPMSAAEVTSSR